MINSVNNNINTTNDLNTSDIRKSIQNIRENKVNQLDIPSQSDGANLNISNLNISENELSSKLTSQNDALAVTQTANRSLSYQKDIVSNLKQQFQNGLEASPQEQDNIANSINNLLDTFTNISDNTTVADKSLIKPTTSEQTLYIETSDQQYSIDQKNGLDMLNGINQIKQNISFDQASVNDNLNTLDNIDSQLSKFQDNFQQIQDDIISKSQQDLSKESDKSMNKTINFGKESSDFNKQNLTSLQGSLISSQANATLENNIRLLV